MKIRVNPHNVEIIREQTEPVNEKEIKVSKCEFEFSDEITNNYVKEAYFTLNGETYKQIIQNNECEYPSEVLDKKGTLEIGVVAYKVENEQEIQRYNPSPDYFESWVGSLKDAENSEPITPSEMEQYEQQLQDGLNEIDDKIDEVDEKITEIDTKIENIDTAIEEANNLNLDVSDKVDGDVTVTLTKKDASTKTVVLSDGTSLEFNWDGTKLGIKTSDEEEYTYVDLQGIQGPAGPQGEAFRIKKTYSSVAEMNADFNNMEYGDYVMIASSVEVEDNAKLYTRGESQWIFITDFSGATGIRGETGLTPSIQIGTVVSGSTPSVTRTGTDENPVLNFVLQKGDKGNTGDTGPTGNGIATIEKTSTSGLVDTYTITYTNGNTTTFDVSNGNGIDRIEKTATVGNKDTYTIYFTNGSTTTYEVTNGEVTREELEEEVERLSMIYNAFPSTTGEVEEGSINGTAEVPFKEIGLKGNTSQESTTGKNLLNVNKTPENIWENTQYEIALNETKVKNNKIAVYSYIEFYIDDLKPNTTYTISFDATISNSIVSIDIMKQRNTTTTQNRLLKMDGTTSGHYSNQFTTESDTSAVAINLYGLRGTYQENAVTTYTNVQIEEGTTATTYEPYTGGNPAPNPDYPYPVNVVTGDNEVKVEGKNLIPNTLASGSSNGITYTVNSDGSIKLSGTATARVEPNLYANNNNPITFKAGTYRNTSSKMIILYANGYILAPPNQTFTLDEDKNVVQIYFRIENGKTVNETYYPQIILNSITDTSYKPYQSQTYPINLGSMELCKIGDYQDVIKRSSGKNIWNEDWEIGAYKWGDGEKTANNSTIRSKDKMPIKSSTTYYLSIPSEIILEFFDENKTFLGSSTNIDKNNSGTFTTPSNAKYFILYTTTTYGTTYKNDIMINEGTTALPYEPYGKVWYKYGAIGKWKIPNNVGGYNDEDNWYYIGLSNFNNIFIQAGATLICTHYQSVDLQDYHNVNGIKELSTHIVTRNLALSSINEYRTFYTNNDVYFYGRLATPTTTEITDTTLIEQLDNLEKAYSYDTQTNISQTNQDKPFIISYEAILSLRNVLEI